MVVDTQHILEAKGGDPVRLAGLLEPFRSYLKLLARMQIGARLQGKADESDIVQETFLSAHGAFPEFRGSTEAELTEWLRSILAAKLAELFRRYLGTKQRDVRLEKRIDDDLSRSAALLGSTMALGLVSREPSPSQHAAGHEDALHLSEALANLPADYREVIVLRNLEGLPFKMVAERMERSEDSVEKLWMRALVKLRVHLGAAR